MSVRFGHEILLPSPADGLVISSFLNSTCQAPGSRLHHLPEGERLAPTGRVRGISWIPGTYVIGIISNVQESKPVL